MWFLWSENKDDAGWDKKRRAMWEWPLRQNTTITLYGATVYKFMAKSSRIGDLHATENHCNLYEASHDEMDTCGVVEKQQM